MDIGWPEILIIAVVILVLFGSKKLPDAARSLGRSMRILKTEVKSMNDEDPPATAAPPVPLPPANTPAAAPLPPATPSTPAGQPTSPVGDSTDAP